MCFSFTLSQSRKAMSSHRKLETDINNLIIYHWQRNIMSRGSRLSFLFPGFGKWTQCLKLAGQALSDTFPHAHFIEVKTEVQGWLYLNGKSAYLLCVNPSITKQNKTKKSGVQSYLSLIKKTVSRRTKIVPICVNTEGCLLVCFCFLFVWFFCLLRQGLMAQDSPAFVVVLLPQALSAEVAVIRSVFITSVQVSWLAQPPSSWRLPFAGLGNFSDFLAW